MKNKKYLFGLVFLIAFSGLICAQDNSLELVKLEVKKATLKEQQALKNGDCETLLSMMDDKITFYANGRPAAPKNMIGVFCKNLPRPFSELTSDSLDVYALTQNSAYVVRKIEYNKNDKTKIKEVVTKIWRKSGDGWKMIHLQSTVKEVSNE